MGEPTTTPAPSVGGAAFPFILIMVAFDFLAFAIIAPVLPDLIQNSLRGIHRYEGLRWRDSSAGRNARRLLW